MTISSFNCDSHVWSSEAISSARRSFCSGVSFSTHFALSNLGSGAVVFASAAAGGPAAAEVKMDAVVAVVDAVDF